MAKERPEIRHLHRNDFNAFCGVDSTHVMMTSVEADTTCAACLREADQEAKDAERERAEAEELVALHEAGMADRDERARAALEAHLARRQAARDELRAFANSGPTT